MKSIESIVAGQVAQIQARVGASIAPGDVLLIVESMKMEIPLEAEQAGVVHSVLVKVGDTVAEGQIVVEME